MQTTKSLGRLIVLPAITFLLGVGCASAVYWLFVAPENGDQVAATVALSVPTEIDSSAEVQSSPGGVSSSSESAKLTVRSLDDIVEIKSAFEQQMALRSLLSELDEARVVDLMKQSPDIFPEADRYALQSAIVQRLAQQSPNRALSLVLEMGTTYSPGGFVSSIYKDWAHSNLDESVSRAKKLNHHLKRIALDAIVEERSDLSDDTLRAIARDLGQEQVATSAIVQRKIDEAIEDPEKAWNELAIDMQDEPANSWNISRIAQAWVEKSGLGVLDQIHQSLTNTETRLSVIRSVLREAARTDPAGAFSYALTFENGQHDTIVRDIANIWANSEPLSAFTAANGIENSSLRKVVTESVVSTWSQWEPRELLKNVDALPEDLRETASTSALSSISRESPEEAAQLVAAMRSGYIKTSSGRTVAVLWSRQDHSAALEWILNEPGVEEIRSELLSYIMKRLTEVDPQLAMTTALAQPIEEDKTGFGMFGRTSLGMEYQVISALALSDVDKALELLPQVREGPTRDLAFQTVAQSLLMNDEIDKAFNMVQQVPEAERGKFRLSLTTTWVGSDPQGMLKSMDRFPSREAKSQAAVLLVMTNEYNKILSDEQIEEARKYISEEHARALKERDPEGMQSIFQGF